MSLGGWITQSGQPVPLPSAPVALSNLGPSETQLNLISIFAIGLVVFGAGVLAQRVWLIDDEELTSTRGRSLAGIGIVSVAIGAAVTVWWASLIDVSAAWTQAWWVVTGAIAGAVGTVASVVVRPRTSASTSARVVTAVGSAVSVVGFAWLGHSRTATPTWLTNMCDVAHLLCGAVWVGGVTVVVASAVGTSSLGGDAISELLGRFSALAAAAVGVLAVSGTLLGWRIAGSFGQLFAGDRGTLLVIKLVLAWTAIVLATINGLVLAPKARRSGRWGRVREVASFELVVLVAVLVVAALLTNESPLGH